MPGNYDSLISNDVRQGVNLQITPIVLTWVEKRTVANYGLDSYADNALPDNFLPLDAYNELSGTGELTAVGDPHKVYTDAYCVACDLTMQQSDSTTDVTQAVSYMMPGKFSSYQIDEYQQTEVRNFADDDTGVIVDGKKTNLTAVSYIPGKDIAQALKVFFNYPFVANIQVPSIIKSVRVTQYEVVATGTTINVQSGPTRPTWNADPIFGFRVGSVLWIGTQTFCEGTPIVRKVYTFLINQYGWHHFYAVYVGSNGLKPVDAVPFDPNTIDPTTPSINARQNGSAAFVMLPSGQFHDLFPQLKPPCQPSNTGAVVPASDQVIPPDSGLA